MTVYSYTNVLYQIIDTCDILYLSIFTHVEAASFLKNTFLIRQTSFFDLKNKPSQTKTVLFPETMSK